MNHTAQSQRIALQFEKPMIFATLLVIPTVIIEGSGAGAGVKSAASALNWAIWIAFAAELVTMLVVVPEKVRWLRTHPLEVVIVTLTVPIWPASLQAARLFRLARLVRLVLLLRLSRRLLSPSGLKFAAATVGLAVLGGGAAFEAAERGHHDPAVSMWDGVWWAMSTVTTVGYGDVRAYTVLGRMVGIVLMVLGIGLAALLTGAIARYFLDADVQRVEEAESRIEVDQHAIAEELRGIVERLTRLESRLVRRQEP